MTEQTSEWENRGLSAILHGVRDGHLTVESAEEIISDFIDSVADSVTRDAYEMGHRTGYDSGMDRGYRDAEFDFVKTEMLERLREPA